MFQTPIGVKEKYGVRQSCFHVKELRNCKKIISDYNECGEIPCGPCGSTGSTNIFRKQGLR